MMSEFELEQGEQVVRETRKHWLLFVLELLPFAILAVIPFALPNLITYAPPLAPFAERIDYGDPVQRAVLGIWLLLVWTGAWGAFTRYFLNAWVLTTNRIVNIKQRAFWSRSVSSLMLPRVQDVTTDVHGVLSSLLNIGDIKVQSAGEDVEFVMAGIPRPEEMRDLILKYVPDAPPAGGV